jgi:hypothetical protein
LDWAKIKSIDDYIEANREARPLMKDWLPRLTAAVREWDAAFNIRYFEFRSKMKEITMSNLSQIRGAKIATKSDEKNFMNQNGEFILYPIDDDDWVSENIFEEICSHLGPEDEVAVWPFGFFRGSHIMVTDIEKPIDNIRWMYSNNAALTRKGYEKFRRICSGCDFLEDHREADVYCQVSAIRVIRKALSAYNHSPASATKLWSLSWGDRNPKKSIGSLISEYGDLPAVPEDLEWAIPFAKKTWELISDLRKRRFFL